MGATKIMVIRHAEKPGPYDLGTYANGTFDGVDRFGAPNKECLVTLGWERAGGLVTLFAPPHGPAHSLKEPNALFAAKTGLAVTDTGVAADSDEPSQRPFETLTAVANALQLDINQDHGSDHYDRMLDEALACEGTVLIAWQHQYIPWVNKAKEPGISELICTKTATAELFPIPLKWKSDRYDLVWVFERPGGEGPITKFRQVPQQLLAGDKSYGIGAPYANE